MPNEIDKFLDSNVQEEYRGIMRKALVEFESADDFVAALCEKPKELLAILNMSIEASGITEAEYGGRYVKAVEEACRAELEAWEDSLKEYNMVYDLLDKRAKENIKATGGIADHRWRDYFYNLFNTALDNFRKMGDLASVYYNEQISAGVPRDQAMRKCGHLYPPVEKRR